MAEETKYFVLRQCYDYEEITKELHTELQQGRLRQGWGISDLSLGTCANPVDTDTWCSAFQKRSKEAWSETVSSEGARKRLSILKLMLDMTEGSIVVVPKQPDSEHFTVVVVAGGYTFDDRPQKDRGLLEDDFRHVIPVKVLQQVGYRSSSDSRVVARKMRAYQSAVNNVWNQEFIQAIQTIIDRATDQSRNVEIAEIVSDAMDPLADKALDILRSRIKHDDLEETVRRIFEGAGYEYLDRHVYDRQGGDVDLRFIQRLPMLDDLPGEGAALTVNVQVKQKKGVDHDDAYGVAQLVKMSEGLAINILISTADHFTPECERTAREKGVLLISGKQLGRLLLKYYE